MAAPYALPTENGAQCTVLRHSPLEASVARRRISLATRRNRMESSPAVIVGEKRGRPALVAPPIVETDFAQLEDGSIVELIEDPEMPSRTALAVYKDGEVRYMQKVQSQGQILVPLSRNSELASNVRWARGIEPYGSVELLLSELFSIFDQYMDLDPMYSLLLANFVLSSWMVDQLPVAPYVAIVGPPSSGKTRLLQILRSLCRRSILTADITSAAFYHFCWGFRRR